VEGKKMRTMYIIWLRQLKRYFRSKSRMIGSLGFPILILLALGYGLGPMYQKAGGGNYIDFLAPGIVAMAILFMAMFSGIEVIYDRQFGFLKETLVAPVSRLKIMLGRTLGGATTALFQGILIFIIAILAGFRPAHWAGIPLALVFMIIIGILFTAIGTAIASKMEDMQAFPIIMNFVMMPLFFLSGAIFPLEGLSLVLKVITEINPLTYGVDALRQSLTGAVHFGLATDFIVLGAFTVVFLVFGAYMFSKIEI